MLKLTEVVAPGLTVEIAIVAEVTSIFSMGVIGFPTIKTFSVANSEPVKAVSTVCTLQ